MLIHPTVERLRALGLTAMAEAFLELQNAPDTGELSREDWLGLLVDREVTSRENKRLARRLREARLRQSAVVEDGCRFGEEVLHINAKMEGAIGQGTERESSGDRHSDITPATGGFVPLGLARILTIVGASERDQRSRKCQVGGFF
jgi:hypothetical protein